MPLSQTVVLIIEFILQTPQYCGGSRSFRKRGPRLMECNRHRYYLLSKELWSLCIQKSRQTKKKILLKLNKISVVSWCMWTGTICKWRITENGKDIKQYLHHKTIRNTKKPKFQTKRKDGQATSTHMRKVLFCVGNPLFLLHVWMKGPTVLIFFVHKHGAGRLNVLTNSIQLSR